MTLVLDACYVPVFLIGAGLRDLMARMGHDSERAAIIYQHRARGADAVITLAIDTHADAELRQDGAGPGPAVLVG